MAPELGGVVRPGHAAAGARRSRSAIGRELGLDGSDLDNLETAALLHHVGQVTLDEPRSGRAGRPAARSRRSRPRCCARSSRCRDAADIVAGEPLGARDALRHPSIRVSSAVAVASQALKVASAFDDLTEGAPERSAAALEALYSSPGYVYDSRALEALERHPVATA